MCSLLDLSGDKVGEGVGIAKAGGGMGMGMAAAAHAMENATPAERHGVNGVVPGRPHS